MQRHDSTRLGHVTSMIALARHLVVDPARTQDPYYPCIASFYNLYNVLHLIKEKRGKSG